MWGPPSFFILAREELFAMTDFTPVPVRGENGYDYKVASRAARISFDPREDRTQQGDAIDANINMIVARFGLTGQLPPPRPGGNYGDFTGVTDFRSAMQAVVDAREDFMRYPAEIRSRFGNDPGLFLDFLRDPEKREEAIELGLIAPPPRTPAPIEVRVVEPPAEA